MLNDFFNINIFLISIKNILSIFYKIFIVHLRGLLYMVVSGWWNQIQMFLWLVGWKEKSYPQLKSVSFEHVLALLE